MKLQLYVKVVRHSQVILPPLVAAVVAHAIMMLAAALVADSVAVVVAVAVQAGRVVMGQILPLEMRHLLRAAQVELVLIAILLGQLSHTVPAVMEATNLSPIWPAQLARRILEREVVEQ
jgi:hypothetical protein